MSSLSGHQQVARFERAGTANFNAAFTAQIIIPGPDFGHTWEVSQVSVQSTSVTKIPQAQVYKNSIAPANFVSGTLYAIQDTDSMPNIIMANGDFLVIAAQGGDTGSQISVRVVGIDTYWPRMGSVH